MNVFIRWKLKKGMCIIDVSSGNTGIALALVGKELNYDVTIVAPRLATEDAKSRIRAYDAKLVEVDGFFNRCFEGTQRMMKSNPNYYYWTNQTSNPVVLKSSEEIGNEIAN